MLIATKKGLRHKLSYFHKKQIRSTTMASNVRKTNIGGLLLLAGARKRSHK